MIRHLSLRIAASFLAPLLVLKPSPSQAATVAAETRLDHISIVVIGKGSPVVLIPGLSTPRTVWDDVATDLAKSHRVYLVQINGFAGDAAGANLAPGILDGAVAELAATLAKDHAAPVRLVGHSLGGLTALKFAKAHPDQVDRLMIVDSLPYIAALFARGGPVPAVAAITPMAGMMRDQLASRYGKPADMAAIKKSVDPLALTPAAQAKVEAWSAAADPRVTGEALYEDMTTDLRADLPAIKAPITLIIPTGPKGEDAAKVTAFYGAQFKGAPNVTIVPIADSAHFVMLDAPAPFAAALADFVR